MTQTDAPHAGAQWLRKSDLPKIDPIVSAAHKIRLRKRLTQAIVAERMGTSASRISAIETGKQSPMLSTLRRYVDACECYLEVKVKGR